MCVSDWHTMSDAVLMRAVNRRCDMHDDVAALQLCAPTHAMDAVACDVLKSLFQYVWNLSAPANAAAHRITHKITTQSGRHEVDAARRLNHAHTRLFAMTGGLDTIACFSSCALSFPAPPLPPTCITSIYAVWPGLRCRTNRV